MTSIGQGWLQYEDANSEKPYYYNTSTRESSWTNPLSNKKQANELPPSRASKRKTNNRDSCINCKTNDRNPTGHIQKYCAYAGGPYEQLGFPAAIAAARADAKDKRRRTQRPAAVAQSTDSQQFENFEQSVQLFFEENIEGNDATEQLQAAKKDPLQFVIKQLAALQNMHLDDSRKILLLQQQVSGLDQQVSRHENHIVTLNRSMRSIQGTVHDMRSRGHGY